jgi:hypothetical protein
VLLSALLGIAGRYDRKSEGVDASVEKRRFPLAAVLLILGRPPVVCLASFSLTGGCSGYPF